MDLDDLTPTAELNAELDPDLDRRVYLPGRENISSVSVYIERSTRYRSDLAAAGEPPGYVGGAFLFAGDLQLCFHGTVDQQLDAIAGLIDALQDLRNEILGAGVEAEAVA